MRGAHRSVFEFVGARERRGDSRVVDAQRRHLGDVGAFDCTDEYDHHYGGSPEHFHDNHDHQ